MKDLKKRPINPIPEKFKSYEEAAEFWDSHDTTDYLDIFKDVNVKTKLKKRHYEVEIEEEIAKELYSRARRLGIPLNHLVSDMLRKQIASTS